MISSLRRIKYFHAFIFIISFISAVPGSAELVHIPESLKRKGTEGHDLLVMIHGCKTTALEFAQGTRMDQLADERGFVVYYPEQELDRNIDRCWNWFLPVNQTHLYQSEPELIMGFARKLKRELKLGRIFVAGMSSGGGMAAILASCNAKEISGAAIHSGISYQAALDVLTANQIIQTGPIMNDQLTAKNAYLCSSMPANGVMPVITFQGLADTRVHPLNQNAIARHFLFMNDYMDDDLQKRSITPFTDSKTKKKETYFQHAYSIHDFALQKGAILRKVEIEGLDHAWSGGNPSVPRNDPKGPNASRMILDFFGL